jgi:hypothetical protein
MDEDTDQAQDTVTGESDQELSDTELNDLEGGDGAVSFNFGHIETTYKPQ